MAMSQSWGWRRVGVTELPVADEFRPSGGGTVLLGYCAYRNLAHSRLVKVPAGWFYK